ncbi:hypothetical protein OA264_03565 [Alphaproteobacteria bacterium]|nr:hypothetical protein [Alphaproteobacteria bacterium]
MKYFYIFFLVSNILYFIPKLTANNINIKSCKNLIKALDLNTEAYNRCLFSKAGEKFTADELKACQSHYLTEIERLSYVFKNICK